MQWLIRKGSIEVNASSDEIHSVYSLSNNFYNWDFISNSFSLDLNTKTINAKGVPDIQVADAYIIPENEELYIREGFQILPLSNSILVLDTIMSFTVLLIQTFLFLQKISLKVKVFMNM